MKTLHVIYGSFLLLAASVAPTEYTPQAAAANNLPAAPPTRAWPHELSDAKPDARVVWGKLDNGLRYALLPTKSAPTRASLRMVVLAGSGMEDDDQQGMAHFLEHMAFNGTKNFPNGETFEYFQRLGMAFGAHTNAVTEIDNTIYHLELPRANEELTTDGLRLFRDFLDGMTLGAEEIERERGVILNEQLARNTPGYRWAVGTLRKALDGTKYENRMPLGTAESVRRLKRSRFVDFYETWYTPARTVIVAVGDFDTAMVERALRKQFADAKARRGEAEDPDRGYHTAGDRTTARFTSIPDAAVATIVLSSVEPGRRRTQTKADLGMELQDLLVERMFDKRLAKLVDAPNSPLQQAGLGNERLYNLVARNYLSATCRPENWEAVVATLEQERRRALTHGFTAGELEAAKSDLQGLLEAIIAQAETRQPATLADELVKDVLGQGIFMHPADLAPLAAEYLPNVRTSDCDARFRKHWDTKDLEVSVSGNVVIPNRPEEKILAAFAASQAKPIAAPQDDAVKAFSAAAIGPAGMIVRRNEIPDLGIVQAEFANGVRVNIKPTPFEKSRAQIYVRFGGGLLELPVDKPGLKQLAGEVFIAGGLKNLSFNELNRQISGKFVTVAFNVGDDAFELGGSCLSSSFDLQMQLITAYLTAPGYRPETLRQFHDSMDNIYDQATHSAEGVLAYEGNALLRSGDPRFTLPTKSEVRKLTLADVETCLAAPLAKGYLEVTVVGDVETDAVLKSLSTTLGALPPREKSKPRYASARKLTFPAGMKAKVLPFESPLPRAVSAVCWPTAGAADVSMYRRLSVLRQILQDRLRVKVREELGATYTPSVVYYATDAFPEFGYFAAQLVVDEAAVPQIGPLVRNVAADLAGGTIGDDEFTRAIKPMIDGIDAMRRDNGYWLNAIGDSQERPASLAEIRSRDSEYRAITKGDVAKLAQRYLNADAAVILSALPRRSNETAHQAK